MMPKIHWPAMADAIKRVRDEEGIAEDYGAGAIGCRMQDVECSMSDANANWATIGTSASGIQHPASDIVM